MKNFSLVTLVLLAAMISARCTMHPKAGKVYDPGQVAAGCAGDMQLDGATAMSLATAFSEANGYVTDDFRQKAAKDISMSPSVTPDERDQVLADYISCLEKSAAQ
jgi:hypothetical protein